MRAKKPVFQILFCSAGMLMLILDSRTALEGASQGIDLCVRTVIPTLFPFFVLSVLLTGALGGRRFGLLRPVGRLCGIPEGAEGLLLLGLLGGYPVGAQSVTQAYRDGILSRKQAHRLLGFCSNCGPAFLFGIAGTLFSSPAASWLLWGIHILSALVTGAVLPEKEQGRCQIPVKGSPDVSEALSQSVRILANVCGWIVLTRCCISFLNRWFLWLLPKTVQTWATGLLELTNGCLFLTQLESEPLRFLFAGGFLGFGGLCVGMQTVSVTKGLGTGWYFPGKLLQMSVSLSLAAFLLPLLYPGAGIPWEAFLALPLCAGVILIKRKKEVAFSGKLMYNV